MVFAVVTSGRLTSMPVSGEYKMVLQLVSVLLHGREAKLIADRAADVISGVQNLREAVYE